MQRTAVTGNVTAVLCRTWHGSGKRGSGGNLLPIVERGIRMNELRTWDWRSRAYVPVAKMTVWEVV
jgi:hypothetical protein